MAAIGSQSLGAVNAKQFYVTVSRGQEDVAIFVDDKAAVRRAIQQAGEQLSATELVNGKRELEQRIITRQTALHRSFLDRVYEWWRSRIPHREAWVAAFAKAQANAPATGIHPTPELSRN